MNTKLKEYPFGYVFSTEKLNSLPDHYIENKIDSNYYYYFDEGTQHHISKIDRSFLIIHGDYVHIGIFNDIKQDELAEVLLNLYLNDYEEFLNTLDYIAGRFTIIVKDSSNIYIYPDATNGRSNYYTLDRVLASSHTKLLAEILNYELSFQGESTTEKILLNTPYSNIKSTLPNHFVELSSNSITRFFPRRNNPFTQMSEEKRFQLVEKFWKKQIHHYYNYGNKMIFSITGGLDSRFSLSLSKEYVNDFNYFTYAQKDKIDNSNPTAKMLSKDYGVVKQILNDIPLKHSFFFLQDDPITLTEDEMKVIRKNTISIHQPNLVKYAYNRFGDNLLHLRGNLLEIGQTYLHKNKKITSNKENARNAFLKIYWSEKTKLPEIKNLYDEFTNKIDYFSHTFDYHLADLIYWELRMGRWICEVSNNHDSIFRTINPFNHRALINISLSFSYEQRRDCYMFKEIINRNFPILNFYGINNFENLYEQAKHNSDNSSQISDNNSSNRSYFNEFKVFDTVSTMTYTSKNTNEFFLPKILNKKSEYAEVSIPFERDHGILSMTLINKYTSRDYKKTIFYEIYKNNNLLLKEDISNWSLPNNISIPGLVKDDEVKVRLTINKNLDIKENWEKNSTIEIQNLHQVSSKMNDSRKINFSSPYSIN